MNVRPATADDGEAIRETAHHSLEASYSLSPATIESAVEEWYSDDELEDLFADDDRLVLIAEEDDQCVGFVEAVEVDDVSADLLWLHVAPEHRGHGAGEALFEAIRAELDARGIDHLRGRVLSDNPQGNDFYAAHGFVKAGETKVDIDGTWYIENVYVEEVPDLEPITVEDRELFVDHADTERGSDSPFAVVYDDPDRENQYAYLCTACETLVTAMDTMGTMECEECGNRRKPTRWDAAYL